MSLIALPAEVLLMTCLYLSCSDLGNVAMSCKTLCSPASKALYEDLTLEVRNPSYDKFRKISQLLSLLQSTNALATTVKNIKFSFCTFGRIRIPSAEIESALQNGQAFKCTCKLTKHRKHYTHCGARFLESNILVTLLQQLIDICPKLGSLELAGTGPQSWEYALKFSSMQNLVDFFMPEPCVFDQKLVDQLAKLPHLRKLCLNIRDFLGWRLGSTPPTFKSLTCFKVISNFDLSSLLCLQTFLLSPPHLKSLDLEIEISWSALTQYPDTQRSLLALRNVFDTSSSITESISATENPRSILKGIQQLRLTIKMESYVAMYPDVHFQQEHGLKLEAQRRYEWFQDNIGSDSWGLKGSIGSLKDLGNLNTLEISPLLLFGNQVEMQNLTAFLPDSLQELRLRDDPIHWSFFEREDSLDMMYYIAWTPSELDQTLAIWAEDDDKRLPELKRITGLTQLRSNLLQSHTNSEPVVIDAVTKLGITYDIQEMPKWV